MAESKIEMPCPACPPDCPRLCETCKVFCKVWKEWKADHAEPRPRFTTADAYCNEKNKKAKARAARGGRRR